jgi:hypothetical protein
MNGSIKIDFFIIGSPKCGTTTVHEALRQHPDVFLPASKDKWFLIDDVPNHVGEAELPAYYAGYRDEALVGCSEASLLTFPSGIARVHQYNPDARLIAMLRNPVDRAYSAYWFSRRNLLEDSETFEQALAREEERATGDHRAFANLRYQAQGRYHEQLDAVYKHFPREQVFVGLFDDLKASPQAFFGSLLDWLGVDPAKLEPAVIEQRHNGAGMPRSLTLQRLLVRPPEWARRVYHALAPAGLKATVWTKLVEPLIDRNRAPFRYPPMAAATRAELTAYFAPHNERLAAMLGRDLAAWQ